MSFSKEIKKGVFASIQTKLEALGFNKRTHELLTIPLDLEIFGWVGLNTALRSRDALEVNVVVGVRHQRIERLLSETLGEKFHEFIPPTLAGNIGYLSPANRYIPFLVRAADEIPTVAEQIFNAVERDGLRFARSVIGLKPLIEALQTVRFGLPEQVAYRIPLGLILLGEHEAAWRLLREKLDGMGSRDDPAAQRFKRFASRILDVSAKT